MCYNVGLWFQPTLQGAVELKRSIRNVLHWANMTKPLCLGLQQLLVWPALRRRELGQGSSLQLKPFQKRYQHPQILVQQCILEGAFGYHISFSTTLYSLNLDKCIFTTNYYYIIAQLDCMDKLNHTIISKNLILYLPSFFISIFSARTISINDVLLVSNSLLWQIQSIIHLKIFFAQKTICYRQDILPGRHFPKAR